MIGTDEVQPVDRRMPRLFRRVTVRFGEPLDPARYGDVEHGAPRAARAHRRGDVRDRAALGLRVRRHVRDQARPRTSRCEVAHVASFEDVARRPKPRLPERSLGQPRRSVVRPVPGALDRAVPGGHAARRGRRRPSRRERRVGLPGRVHRRRASPTRLRRCRRGTRRRARSSPAPRRAARARRAGRPGTGTSRSITDAPPSTRISAGAVPLARLIASTTSAVWNAIDSTTARARCARLVPRVMPTIVPRAYGSHHGEPRPGERGHDVDAAGVGDRLRRAARSRPRRR